MNVRGLSVALLAAIVGVSGHALGLPPAQPVQEPPARLRFVADPIADGAILSFAAGTAILSQAILSTGEIQPGKPLPSSNLLAIDRVAVKQTPVPAWGTLSNVGLFAAIGYAAIDPVATGYRDSASAGLVDAVIYSETIAITWSLTNLAKIAFRRPRPNAVREADRNPGVEISSTDSALSFYSGHASITSAISATATYLAFARSPGTARPWLTLGLGALATTLVDIGRIRSGKHFPTDVITGTMAGVGIGVLVPHLHRSEDVKRRPIWIGMGQAPSGTTLGVAGVF
jgi:membrane-associated phospholipid phosphatase